MCWAALDRAVKLATPLGDAAHPIEWRAQRNEVRAAILKDAYDEGIGAYAGAFQSDHRDASVLLMAIMGFVAWSIEQANRDNGSEGAA